MKTKFLLLIQGLFLSSLCFAQSFTDVITKELGFEKKGVNNTVVIANINGNVRVTGYEGDKVIVEVTRTLTAKTQERLEMGKKELQPGVMDRADTLLFFVDGACNQFGKQSKNNGGRNQSQWGYYGYAWSNHCDTKYDYKLDFTVKVPAQVHVVVSTINDGDVTVEHTTGTVNANNVNGNIKLTDLAREARASTVNGDVDINYIKNPEKDCRFYSLNGDINAHFQKGLAADMSFESFNGELFTNMAKLEMLPVSVRKEQKGTLMKYKINGNSFKIGNGGALLDFETFNGNVYVKE